MTDNPPRPVFTGARLSLYAALNPPLRQYETLEQMEAALTEHARQMEAAATEAVTEHVRRACVDLSSMRAQKLLRTLMDAEGVDDREAAHRLLERAGIPRPEPAAPAAEVTAEPAHPGDGFPAGGLPAVGQASALAAAAAQLPHEIRMGVDAAEQFRGYSRSLGRGTLGAPGDDLGGLPWALATPIRVVDTYPPNLWVMVDAAGSAISAGVLHHLDSETDR